MAGSINAPATKSSKQRRREALKKLAMEQKFGGDHYQEEEAPSALTEANVQATLWGLRDTFPSGTVYRAFYRSYSNDP